MLFTEHFTSAGDVIDFSRVPADVAVSNHSIRHHAKRLAVMVITEMAQEARSFMGGRNAPGVGQLGTG